MRTATLPPEELPRSTPSQRPGGRSERVVRDVLQAVLATLAESGYAGLSIEMVALRAGVNKTTVYRRWPTKPELVRAAFQCIGDVDRRTPDTGTLRGDLLALAQTSVARMKTHDGLGLMRMMAIEMDDPEVDAIARAVRIDFQQPWNEVVTRSVERGELPRGTVAELIVDTVVGLIYGRFRKRMPVDDALLEAVIELVLVGAERGGAVMKAAPPRAAKAAASGRVGRVGGARRRDG